MILSSLSSSSAAVAAASASSSSPCHCCQYIPIQFFFLLRFMLYVPVSQSTCVFLGFGISMHLNLFSARLDFCAHVVCCALCVWWYTRFASNIYAVEWSERIRRAGQWCQNRYSYMSMSLLYSVCMCARSASRWNEICETPFAALEREILKIIRCEIDTTTNNTNGSVRRTKERKRRKNIGLSVSDEVMNIIHFHPQPDYGSRRLSIHPFSNFASIDPIHWLSFSLVSCGIWRTAPAFGRRFCSGTTKSKLAARRINEKRKKKKVNEKRKFFIAKKQHQKASVRLRSEFFPFFCFLYLACSHLGRFWASFWFASHRNAAHGNIAGSADAAVAHGCLHWTLMNAKRLDEMRGWAHHHTDAQILRIDRSIQWHILAACKRC